jgi:hypothetical protein
MRSYLNEKVAAPVYAAEWIPLQAKDNTDFSDNWRQLGRYISLAD